MTLDVSKLKAALRRTAADGVGTSGAVPVASAEDGVDRVLDAIDATLLPRRLTVVSGSGETLVIEAAGRRLQRVAAPVPGAMAISAGEELKSSDVASFAAGLLAFCQGAGTLSIQPQPMTGSGDPAEGGISPDLVRTELELPVQAAPIDAEADLNMEPFISGLASRCRAALWIQDEDVSLLAGAEDRAAVVSQWAAPMLERLLAPEFPLSAGLETDGIVVFVLPDAEGRHAVIAGRLGAYFVAEIEGADPSPTLQLWHEAHA